MKTIVGTWHDTRGNLAAWGKLHLVLNQDAHVILTAQVAPRSMTFSLDQNGSLMAGSKVWANDELDPPGTYYTATVTANGGGVIWGPQWVIIAGFDPVDLTSITPLRMIPPLNQFSTSTTPAVFAAGVSDTPVSSELGFDPSAFMTVSDQLILAPGANVWFSGSRSQHSMTVTINATGGGGTGTGGAAFTAGIGGGNTSGAGSTVSNQLLIAGGSNITISRTTNAAGMTMSIIGLSQGTGQTFQAGLTGNGTVGAGGPVSNRLYLAGGNNITLEGTTNASGMTVTVVGEPQGTAGGGGSFSAGLGGGNVSGNLGPVGDRLYLAGGSNITLSGSTNAGSMSITVSGASIPARSVIAGANISLTTGSNSAGFSTTIAAAAAATGGGGGSVSLIEGSNITIASATNASGTTATIHGASAGSFIGGISGGNLSGNTGTVTNRLVLAGGANVTLSGSTNASGMTASVSALPWPTLSLISGGAGTIQGAANANLSSLRLAAGSNILLAQNGNSLTINALATGGDGATGGGGAVSFVEGNNISISQAGIAGVGTTATIAAGDGASPFNLGLIGGVGGSIAGVTATRLMTDALRLVAGSNITLSGTTNASGYTVSIRAWDKLRFALNSGGGGTVSNLVAADIGNLRLVAGSNIGLTNATDAVGATVTIGAAGGPGGGSPFWAGIHTSLESVTTLGTQWGSTVGNVGPMSNGLSLAAGPNITLLGETNQSGQMITIRAPKPFSAIASSFAGGGSFAGATFNITNGLLLYPGSNITFSGNQTASVGNGAVTIIGGAGYFNAMISGGGAGSTQGVSSVAESGLRLQAGSNITLSASSNTNRVLFVTINAAGGGTGTGAGFTGGLTNFNTAATLSSASASTYGNTGTVSNQFVLAAGSFISLSGSTNASGMTASIIGPRPVGLGIITAPGGSTAGVSTPIIATANLRLAAGSNIRISGTTSSVVGSVGATYTIDTPSLSVFINDAGGSTTGTTEGSNVRALYLHAGQNVTLSGMTASQWPDTYNVYINAGGGASGSTAADHRYFGMPLPIIPMLTSQTTFVHNSVIFWPFQMLVQNSNFTAAILPLYMAMPMNGSQRGAIGISLGIYTRTGSTLSQAGSVNYTTSWSTNSLPLAFLGGWRLVNIPWGHSFAADKDHWLALRLSSSSSYQSFNISGLNYQQPGIVGFIADSSANPLIDAVPGWGVYTGNSLPSSVAFSAIASHAEDPLVNTPMLYFAGFSA